MIDKKNLEAIFDSISEPWNPHIVGELNGQYVKAAKFQGTFPMHKHDDEDEMFLVVKGEIKIQFEDRELELMQGEFTIVPKGVMHQPSAANEACVLLFEPKATLNTGNITNEYTQTNLKSL